jgi:hypothetical protein
LAMIPTIEYEISTYKLNGIHIVKRRFVPEQKEKSLAELQPEIKSITELNPTEVFSKKLEGIVISDEDKKTLMLTYAELLNEVQNGESL